MAFPAGFLKDYQAMLTPELRPANAVGPTDQLVQNVLSVLKRQGSDVVPVCVKDVKEVEIGRKPFHPFFYFAGILQMEALLKQAEGGVTLFVKTDHLAVDDRLPRQAFAQGSDDVRELKVL